MSQYITQRLIQLAVTLLGLSIIVFALAHLAGNPVEIMASPEATAEDIERLEAKLGLDRPIYIQYWRFLSNALQGEFGKSIRWEASAIELILERFPNTILLAASSMLFGLCLSIPIGVLSAVHRGSLFDSFGKVLALMGQSMPAFWIGILLIMGLSLYIPIFPTSGIGTVGHLVLPSITLGGYIAASMMRVTRSAMIDALDADFIRTAHSKGVPRRLVIWKHALRNAAIPIITIIGLQAANILRGAVVTETVFSWPGLGKLAVEAVYTRDFPLVQASVLFMGLVFTVTNVAIDIIYVMLDPRISYEKR